MLTLTSRYRNFSHRKQRILSLCFSCHLFSSSSLCPGAVVVVSALTPVIADNYPIELSPRRSSGSIIKMSLSSVAAARNGYGTTSSIDEDVQDFHQYAAAAVDLTMVHASSSSEGTGGILSVIRSCRNWDAEQRQSYLYRFSLKHDDQKDNSAMSIMPPAPLDPSVKIYLPSPSGKKTVVVKEESKADDEASKSKKKTIVEIWHGPSLLRRIPINEAQQGKIINDATGFGSPVWSPDETCLLYNAERIPPKTEPFWTAAAAVGGTDDDDDTSHSSSEPGPVRGGTNVFGVGQREHWGERYNTQEPILDLYVMNLDTGRTGRIHNVPSQFPSKSSEQKDGGVDCDESVTLGEAVWHPSGETVAFTAWDAGLPKRLGMIYCRNRACKVFEACVSQLLRSLATSDTTEDDARDKELVCCSEPLPYARSPRYIQMDGKSRLVFLGNERTFVSHDACMGLFGVDSNGSIDCIVPVVDVPRKDGHIVYGMGFPGLFLGQLPLICSIVGDSNDYLVTTSLFGSVQRVLRIDIANGNVDVVELPQLDESTSQTVCALSPDGDLVVAVTSFTRPPCLWLVAGASLQQAGVGGKVVVDACEIAIFEPVATSAFSPIETKWDVPFDMKMLSVDPPEIEGTTTEPIQAILLLPKEASAANPVPLVVVPHGGPHSCTTSSFVPGFTHLATKFAVLFPNYRGSIGFGQASADSLLTRIGHVDVQDVMACTRHAVNDFSEINGEKIGICGGSHGGFLTAHCTSQYPDFFKAAACRNPVTNIASMLTSTDIPDWCFAEAFGSYDQALFQGPTREQIAAMYEKSPVARINEVKTPTLVALGKVDLRVPYSQGLEWYHSLRSKGVPTKLLLYPKDCHALDRDTTEADHWIHIRHWFDQHLS